MFKNSDLSRKTFSLYILFRISNYGRRIIRNRITNKDILYYNEKYIEEIYDKENENTKVIIYNSKNKDDFKNVAFNRYDYYGVTENNYDEYFEWVDKPDFNQTYEYLKTIHYKLYRNDYVKKDKIIYIDEFEMEFLKELGIDISLFKNINIDLNKIFEWQYLDIHIPINLLRTMIIVMSNIQKNKIYKLLPCFQNKNFEKKLFLKYEKIFSNNIKYEFSPNVYKLNGNLKNKINTTNVLFFDFSIFNITDGRYQRILKEVYISNINLKNKSMVYNFKIFNKDYIQIIKKFYIKFFKITKELKNQLKDEKITDAKRLEIESKLKIILNDERLFINLLVEKDNLRKESEVGTIDKYKSFSRVYNDETLFNIIKKLKKDFFNKIKFNSVYTEETNHYLFNIVHMYFEDKIKCEDMETYELINLWNSMCKNEVEEYIIDQLNSIVKKWKFEDDNLSNYKISEYKKIRLDTFKLVKNTKEGFVIDLKKGISTMCSGFPNNEKIFWDVFKKQKFIKNKKNGSFEDFNSYKIEITKKELKEFEELYKDIGNVRDFKAFFLNEDMISESYSVDRETINQITSMYLSYRKYYEKKVDEIKNFMNKYKIKNDELLKEINRRKGKSV